MKAKLATLAYLFLTAIGCAQSENFDEMATKMGNDDVPFGYVNDTEYVRYIFLDTRSKEEYDVSHIEGAIWVGYKEFDLEKVKDLDKSASIMVYCSVGYRSGKIGEDLQEAGFENVKNLYGGIFAWINAEREVVDNNNVATTKVHAYSKKWGQWLEKGEKVY